MLLWWIETRFHIMNIWKIGTNIVPLCSAYIAPSSHSDSTFREGSLRKLDFLNMFLWFVNWIAVLPVLVGSGINILLKWVKFVQFGANKLKFSSCVMERRELNTMIPTTFVTMYDILALNHFFLAQKHLTSYLFFVRESQWERGNVAHFKSPCSSAWQLP